MQVTAPECSRDPAFSRAGLPRVFGDVKGGIGGAGDLGGVNKRKSILFQMAKASHLGFRSAAITHGAADHSDRSCNEPSPGVKGTFADECDIPGVWSADVLCQIGT